MLFSPGIFWMVTVMEATVLGRRTILICKDCLEKLDEVYEFLVHRRIEGLLLSIEGLLLSQSIVTFFDRFLKLEETGTISHGNGIGEEK
jgi:hypothetical protein